MKKVICIVTAFLLFVSFGCSEQSSDMDIIFEEPIYGEGFDVIVFPYIMDYYAIEGKYINSKDIRIGDVDEEACYYSAVDVSSRLNNEILTRFTSYGHNVTLQMTSHTYKDLTSFELETILDTPLVVRHESFQSILGNVLGIMKISITCGGPRTYYSQKMYYFDLETGEELSLEMLIKPKLREEFYLSIVEKIPPYYSERIFENSKEYSDNLYKKINYHLTDDGLIFTAIIIPGELTTYFADWEGIESYIDKNGHFYKAILVD